jgi:hypothetical protein
LMLTDLVEQCCGFQQTAAAQVEYQTPLQKKTVSYFLVFSPVTQFPVVSIQITLGCDHILK